MKLTPREKLLLAELKSCRKELLRFKRLLNMMIDEVRKERR